ncbi:MAG: hypothetical protein AAFW84_04365 [Cyanobacteria bacterium J06635_15]
MKDAQPEQLGSFCDVESQHHYTNVNGLLACIAINEAEDRGDDVLIVDRTPGTEAYTLNERFNLFRTTQDNHGLLVAEELRVEVWQ